MLKGIQRIQRGATAFALVLALWWLVTGGLRLVDPVIMPGPGEVGYAIIRLLTTGPFLEESNYGYRLNLIGHMLHSVFRVAAGFALAVVTAIPIGTMMGISRIGEKIFDPIVQLLRPIPPIAWTPLAITWFGTGMQSIMFLIWLGAFWPLVLNTSVGVSTVRPTLLQAARSLGAMRLQLFWRVLMPAAMPFIFSGMRLSLAVGWWMVVPAEMLASRSGLGYLIIRARAQGITHDVIAGILVIGVTGWAVIRCFRVLERWRVFRVN